MPSKKKTTKKQATAKKAAKKTTRKQASKKTAKKTTAKRSTKKPSCGCSTACKSEYAFWVNNGPVVHSLKELLEAMENMSDKQYTHHTKNKTNDFACWIRDCLNDTDCASRVRRAKTRTGTVRILKKRCAC